MVDFSIISGNEFVSSNVWSFNMRQNYANWCPHYVLHISEARFPAANFDNRQQNFRKLIRKMNEGTFWSD